jgi:predicted HAD superfamily Cof-like phosphohydrolase
MQEQVLEFHKKFGCAIGDRPGMQELENGSIDPDDKNVTRLRRSLITEEFIELELAFDEGNFEMVIDALCDLMYVINGTGVAFGIDLEPFFDEVHRANMTKEGGMVRSDGKILKPIGWQPPDIVGILKKQELPRE